MRASTMALLVVLAIVLIALAFCRRGRHRKGREGYLIYPYLDLDEPGERGQYYAMSEC